MESGDKVQIVRGKYAGRTGLVTNIKHGFRNLVSYKHITIKLDNGGQVIRLNSDTLLKKVEEETEHQHLDKTQNGKT